MITTSVLYFFFSSRRRHTRLQGDWSSDVCSSDLGRRHHCEHGGTGLVERHNRRVLRGPERHPRERRQALAHLELGQYERRRELARERLCAERPVAVRPAFDRAESGLPTRYVAVVL